MKRRAFLQYVAVVEAIMALPAYRTARLIEDFGLPVDAAKVVFRRTGNYLVSPEVMAREALAVLEHHLVGGVDGLQ